MLGWATDPAEAGQLAEAIAELDPTADDRTRTREALLVLLGRASAPHEAQRLVRALVALNPIVADLGGSDRWPISPTPALLAAVRRNTKLSAWLAVLPLLSQIHSHRS